MRTSGKVSVVDIKNATEESSIYSVAAESMSVSDKLAVLEKMGRADLVDIFKDWQPRQAKAKRKTAPLDQRVSITVTDQEKFSLQKELAGTNKAGEKITVSQFVRNRAIGSVDINGWRVIAEVALKEINEIDENRAELAKRERALRVEIENEDEGEEETVAMLEIELSQINAKFKKIIAQNEKRSHRLSGRMSMVEAETIKWRAARLCISTSDYLRFLIFDLIPDTAADRHMSLDAKRRFYVSIIDVSNNGWGEPPTIAHCTQCSNYMEEIRRLRDQVKQLETYV